MARPGFVAYLFVVQCTTAVLCRCFYIRFVLPLIFATLRHLYQCGSSGIADPDRSAGSASLRRGRNGRNQPSVVCGGGIRSVILFCYSIPFCRSAELSCCRSDRRTGISETIRYFSLGAGLVSPLSAGREMPYRTARIRMRITEQAAMNCVGAAGRSRYIQR